MGLQHPQRGTQVSDEGQLMGHLGIQIGAATSPAELATVVRRAEALGYGEVWLAEDYFELGGVASVAMALASTDHIPVGLGVVAAAARHPAVSAMEFATLGGAFPGRFMAGLGHGAPGWVRQMGLAAASPLRLLREATEAIRRLLDGARVTTQGDYFELAKVRLAHLPPIPVPLYFGVQGPASLRLSGELADGTLLGWFSSPGYVAWARRRIDEGRARGGRQDEHELAVLCLLSVADDDPEGVSRDFARFAAPMLVTMRDGHQLTSSPEGVELNELVSRVGVTDLATRIPSEMLRRIAAVGRTEDAAQMVQGLLDAGADRVVLVPNPAGFRSTSAMLDQMQLARDLAP